MLFTRSVSEAAVAVNVLQNVPFAIEGRNSGSKLHLKSVRFQDTLLIRNVRQI